MSKNNLVENLSSIADHEDVYEVFQFVKHARLPFLANRAWRASEKIHLVHIDICGPIKTSSSNGSSLWFLLMIARESKNEVKTQKLIESGLVCETEPTFQPVAGPDQLSRHWLKPNR
ncbi:Retrovirus-related Pol polyprotein from transposon TNT 1-94 [Gossypium australe]|uniref:Retrovirus-related Pol polyprotein from transposon TNT 1-94 n=1 Tax=Gossypium australe TaxID=47621 RepID=A0A5B6V1M1_9ROSI|nr:Retrovirus-related Pol polyprotein from transposon TNT 1-94 [Gossypium australe]